MQFLENIRFKNISPVVAKLLVKRSVRFKTINPAVLFILKELLHMAIMRDISIVITSANDGKHRKDSLHYKDRAIDIRAVDKYKRIGSMDEEEALAVRALLQNYLGSSYDVVYEYDHIHIEYDPK